MVQESTKGYQLGITKRNKDAVGGAEDFVQTPPVAVRLLLEREQFDGVTWEPAAGRGAISKVLEESGMSVRSTDLLHYDYGKSGVDFFKSKRVFDNIVTNPPYSLMVKFIAHGHTLFRKKMALLLPLTALGSSQVRVIAISNPPPARIYAFIKKIPYVDYQDQERSSTFPHMWVVWDKQADPTGGTRFLWLRSFKKEC